MTLFDWLGTPAGIEMQHAIIVFLIALSGWLTYLTHRATAEQRRLLNHHLEQHMMRDLEDNADSE